MAKPQLFIHLNFLPSATKLRRLCFYRRLSVHMKGVCLSACWDTTPLPQSRQPPGVDIPPGPDRPPRADTPWDQTPRDRTPPSRETATAADGTHPTGMHSCFNFTFLHL